MAIDKQQIDLVYRLTDDDDLFDFLKEQAYCNEALAQALLKQFLPKKPESSDLRGEVRSVFENADETYDRWGPSLDWHGISSGLYRMMEKASYLRKSGLPVSAAMIACQIITSVGEEYTKDSVFADDNFDGDEFSTGDAVQLLIDMAESGELDAGMIRQIEQEVKAAERMETYRGYCICDFEELLNVLSSYSESVEEHLAVLDERISKCHNPNDRNPWLIRKEAYLRRIGQSTAADELLERYFSVPEFSRRVVDQQIASGQIQKAIQSLRRIVSMEHDIWNSSYLNESHDRLLSLYEEIGDTEGQAEECSWKLVSGHGEISEVYGKLQGLLSSEALKALLSSKFEQIREHRLWYHGEEVVRMFASEGMIEEVAQLLSIHEFGNNEGIYAAFKEHVALLSEEQRKSIVEVHVNALREYAIETNSKHYSSIRYQMELLRDTCEEGAAAICLLTQEFRQKYPRRVAMMSELKRLDK